MAVVARCGRCRRPLQATKRSPACACPGNVARHVGPIGFAALERAEVQELSRKANARKSELRRMSKDPLWKRALINLRPGSLRPEERAA